MYKSSLYSFFETVHAAHIFSLEEKNKIKKKFCILLNPSQDVAMSNYERFLSLKKTKITASYFRSGS